MSQSNPQISIILPTYDEAGNIELLIDRTLVALENYPGGVEVVVVDDNSPDGTWRLVAEKAAADPRVRLIHRTTEKGLTSAIGRGFGARGRHGCRFAVRAGRRGCGALFRRAHLLADH
jgi:dolichol-phosphate mannosyltransferase